MLRAWMLGLVLASPVLAQPAAPVFESPVTALEFGVFCDTSDGERIPAPGTQLGYIETAPGQIAFSWVRQSLPADIGLAFGVIARTSRDVEVVIKVHRPDLPAPETWTSTLWAVDPGPTYFTFDFPQEQVPGLWAIEAWEGETRLYRAEFLVTPTGSDAGLSGLCRLMS